LPDAPDDAPPAGRLRRTREALLLELGALVYELHRQGKRAPALLRRKAGELSAVDERLRGAAADEPGPGACPSCGAETGTGQLVCTNCGARLALGRRRPDRRVALLVAAAAAAMFVAAGAGFALSEITGDGGDDTPAANEAARAPTTSSAAPDEPRENRRAEAPADRAPREPRRRLLLDWPDGLTAHTVVLVTTSDRAAALRLARQAARSGIETGLLRGADYNLGSGLWVVFAGRFDTPEGAARQASGLAERYPGAYPQLVEPAG
jgi:SPOR domain